MTTLLSDAALLVYDRMLGTVKRKEPEYLMQVYFKPDGTVESVHHDCSVTDFGDGWFKVEGPVVEVSKHLEMPRHRPAANTTASQEFVDAIWQKTIWERKPS